MVKQTQRCLHRALLGVTGFHTIAATFFVCYVQLNNSWCKSSVVGRQVKSYLRCKFLSNGCGRFHIPVSDNSFSNLSTGFGITQRIDTRLVDSSTAIYTLRYLYPEREFTVEILDRFFNHRCRKRAVISMICLSICLWHCIPMEIFLFDNYPDRDGSLL